MRILFNATNVRSQGGVILLRHLLEGFAAHGRDAQILLYLNPQLAASINELAHAAWLEVIPFRPRGYLGRFLWEQIELPRIIRRRNIDLLFSFGNTGPRFPGCRQVLYLQQAIPYSDYRPPTHRLQWLYFKRLYGWLIGLAQSGSERIIVPTSWLVEPMRKSIGCRKTPEAYRVSLPGPIAFASAQSNLADPGNALLKQVKSWRDSGQRILLYPCHLAPYKNIPYLLEAIRLLPADTTPPFKLLLTFDRESPEYFPCKREIFETLDRHPDERIVLAGSQDRPVMAALYRQTDILLFPSLVETLGLPLLEALQSHIPIVALAQAPFAREICGDAALYADAGDPASFSENLKSLQASRDVAARLSREAQGQADGLSWGKHIRDILDI